MIHMLGGGSRHNASEFYGRRIVSAALHPGEDQPNGLDLRFEDGTGIRIWDDGQSCCESRYTSTDDDIGKIVGGVLSRIEPKEAPNLPDEYGEHEQVFIEVGTDECFITLVTHNEHNGYYGGFGLSIDTLEAP